MEKHLRDHKQILREELSKRMSVNPLYSLRAFARDMSVSPQYLSNVMNGKKGLSQKTALLLAERLGLSGAEREYFCSLIQSQFSRSKTVKTIAKLKLESLSQHSQKTNTLTVDSFRVISDWYHFGLIELLKIKGAKTSDPIWMAKQLGIQVKEVEMALERMTRLELIRQRKRRWVPNQDSILTGDGVPSEAIRTFHKQVLDKARAALTLQSIETRYVSTSMLPIALEDLPRAKKTIQDFRNRFIQNHSNSNTDSRVYALSVQFFDLLTGA